MDSYQATDDFLTKHFSLPARRFDTCALSELEPVVSEDVAGGCITKRMLIYVLTA
jgi:hypothetical protein